MPQVESPAAPSPSSNDRTASTRNAVLPDLYVEDFSAAVDFLGTRPQVDRERIGAIGICGRFDRIGDLLDQRYHRRQRRRVGIQQVA